MDVTVLKLLVVLFFLIKFLRRPTVVWGIGLLTVTTAVLLDTLLGTFDRDALLGELGFFFYVIAGALLAGSAAWFWGVVRPWLPGGAAAAHSAVLTPMTSLRAADVHPVYPAPLPAAEMPTPSPRAAAVPVVPPPRPPGHEDGYAAAGYDRQMLYEEIRHRFSHDDLQDLMFDLDVNELDVVVPGQTNDELIIRVMDAADDSGQTGAVALAGALLVAGCSGGDSGSSAANALRLGDDDLGPVTSVSCKTDGGLTTITIEGAEKAVVKVTDEDNPTVKSVHIGEVGSTDSALVYVAACVGLAVHLFGTRDL